MKDYTVVGGVGRVGADQVIEISPEQYEPRAHNVELIEQKGKRYKVRGKVTLEFMAGETLKIAGEIPHHMQEVFVPSGGQAAKTAKAKKDDVDKSVEKRLAKESGEKASESRKALAKNSTASDPKPKQEPAPASPSSSSLSSSTGAPADTR